MQDKLERQNADLKCRRVVVMGVDALGSSCARAKGEAKRVFVAAAIIAALLCFEGRASVAEDLPLQNNLIATSQSLLDAVTAGDKQAFVRTLDPDGVFVDEEGIVRRGAELADAIRGLPAGYVGNLRMVDPQVRIVGDVAIVTYGIAETLSLYGQTLNTRYHTTDVYHRERGSWTLIASQASVFPSALEPIAINPTTLHDYEGTYRLGADVSARVWTEQGKLYMQREGRPREELLPIGGDRFVRTGALRGERFFCRNAANQVIELVDRRDNNDLVWRRV